MLDIIGLVLLCIKNNSNAKLRGRSGAGAVLYTIALWFGFGVAGAFVAVGAQWQNLEAYYTYGQYSYSYGYMTEDEIILRFLGFILLGYLIGVIMGGVVSYLISRRGEPVNIIPTGSMYNPNPYYGGHNPYGQPGYPAQAPYGQPQQSQSGYGQPPVQQPPYGQPTQPGYSPAPPQAPAPQNPAPYGQGQPPYRQGQPPAQPYGQPGTPTYQPPGQPAYGANEDTTPPQQ